MAPFAARFARTAHSVGVRCPHVSEQEGHRGETPQERKDPRGPCYIHALDQDKEAIIMLVMILTLCYCYTTILAAVYSSRSSVLRATARQGPAMA
ncbi:hypothetical protein CFAM422_006420 [Trichoderma lentiforme]|uniref:Uncharacterized protein n=1 Tax=Trichoderma lentiforme TaxID=1567552 RepID=A0A9P4XES7_9HYPO|nr:hypothetical protein CFAM422_006420 [Trichoderma lentiforme]